MANRKPDQTLGETIQQARIAAGPSLRETAKALGITPSYLSDIENDRRVPSEEVLRTIADRLRLDFDHLMALAGRFGEQADRYLKRHPAAGMLFRRISETNLSDEALQLLLEKARELGKKGQDE
jgi:transcriptional regulator with XRE-family HTH domain